MSSETFPGQYHHKSVPMQDLDMDGIPRDTLGNPMPAPVPAGFVSRLQPTEWGDYWMRSPNGSAPVSAQSELECQESQKQLDLPHLKLCICSFVNLLFSEIVTVISHRTLVCSDIRSYLCHEKQAAIIIQKSVRKWLVSTYHS